MTPSWGTRAGRTGALVAAVATAVTTTLSVPQPVYADGAASTRNIIFGAAAIGGTLLILNHNKKVHEKYAEYDRQQAQDEEARNQAEAAYESERQAYGHEAALVDEYRQEVAYQHSQVVARDNEIVALKRSLVVAKYGKDAAERVAVAPHERRPRRVARSHGRRQPSASPAVAVRGRSGASTPQVVSYGWGSY